MGKWAFDGGHYLNVVYKTLMLFFGGVGGLRGPPDAGVGGWRRPGWGTSFRHRAPAGAHRAPRRTSLMSPAVAAPSLCRKAAGRRYPTLSSASGVRFGSRGPRPEYPDSTALLFRPS